jgi:uncharacterized membrane protein (Fun14 family)
MQNATEAIAANTAGGFFVGFAVGYTLKKGAGFALFVVGFGLLFILLMEQTGVVRIQDDALVHLADLVVAWLKEAWQIFFSRIERMGEGGGVGVVAGLLLGLKKA